MNGPYRINLNNPPMSVADINRQRRIVLATKLMALTILVFLLFPKMLSLDLLARNALIVLSPFMFVALCINIYNRATAFSDCSDEFFAYKGDIDALSSAYLNALNVQGRKPTRAEAEALTERFKSAKQTLDHEQSLSPALYAELRALREAFGLMGLDPVKVAELVSSDGNDTAKAIMFGHVGLDETKLLKRVGAGADLALWHEYWDQLKLKVNPS